MNSGPFHGQSKPHEGVRKAEARAAQPEHEAAGGRARGGGGGGGSLRWWRRCCRHPQSLLPPAPANCSGGGGAGAPPRETHPCVAPHLLLRRPQPVSLLKVCRVVLLAVPLHPTQPWLFVDRRGLSWPDGQGVGGESTIWRRGSGCERREAEMAPHSPTRRRPNAPDPTVRTLRRVGGIGCSSGWQREHTRSESTGRPQTLEMPSFDGAHSSLLVCRPAWCLFNDGAQVHAQLQKVTSRWGANHSLACRRWHCWSAWLTCKNRVSLG